MRINYRSRTFTFILLIRIFVNFWFDRFTFVFFNVATVSGGIFVSLSMERVD